MSSGGNLPQKLFDVGSLSREAGLRYFDCKALCAEAIALEDLPQSLSHLVSSSTIAIMYHHQKAVRPTQAEDMRLPHPIRSRLISRSSR